MDLEQFLKAQARELDETFSLTQDEEAARAEFEQLASDTYDFLNSLGSAPPWSFRAWPESAGNFLNGAHRNLPVPPQLLERWQNWNQKYYELRARNPRLELRDEMQNISESVSASSWPAGYETLIDDWILAGNPNAPPPFTDRYDIVRPLFYERLCKLREMCGGFLYWNDESSRVVFAPEAEWQVVRRARADAEAKRLKAQKIASAKFALKMQRLEEIAALARSDADFWNTVKMLKGEASGKLPGRVIWAFRGNDPPAMFAEFIARVHQPDDVVSWRDIVFHLVQQAESELDAPDRRHPR